MRYSKRWVNNTSALSTFQELKESNMSTYSQTWFCAITYAVQAAIIDNPITDISNKNNSIKNCISIKFLSVSTT